MGTEHLDLLHKQLPELFDPREPPQGWDDDLIIIPIDDPGADESPSDALHPNEAGPENVLWPGGPRHTGRGGLGDGTF
jgi:hypothetical protein